MTPNRRQAAWLAPLALAVAVAAGRLAPSAGAAQFPADERAIAHVLNRIGYGPRPGDVEKVRTLGLQKYIDQQLRPDRIADAAMSPRLASLSTLGMSGRDIAQQFEMPIVEARRANKDAAVATGGTSGANGGPGEQKMPNPMQQKANRLVAELAEQKVLRATFSDRQLEEVLTDFWFNHFNVDARKGRDRFMLTEYERDAIRPHVLGKFRDLLGATAKSPAMLFYLDNWLSADPNGPHMARREGRIVRGPYGRLMLVQPPPGAPQQGQNAPKGLNENYGRELMELHTLGVDGGYTQKDVTEVARSFTGWSIQNPRQGAEFKFEPRLHDTGQKIVLGHVIRAGRGVEDGEEVLDLLARHPSTARFIATKLVRRFVGDVPPPSLVERAVARFRETDGDLREVTRTILTSPEFLTPDNYRAKVKTPFEFVVSALRATGADVGNALPLVRTVQQLGMPLYQCQPPTGYKDTADAWMNTGALVSRMNFALQLAGNKLPGVSIQDAPSLDGPDVMIAAFLGGDVSSSTRATIGKATSAPQVAALTLGSPEFQRR
jgi:uncharacterized protein (DUF1800 family)